MSKRKTSNNTFSVLLIVVVLIVGGLILFNPFKVIKEKVNTDFNNSQVSGAPKPPPHTPEDKYSYIPPNFDFTEI